jgi:hypothetical protein
MVWTNGNNIHSEIGDITAKFYVLETVFRLKDLK